MLSGLDKEIGDTLSQSTVTENFVGAFNRLQDAVTPPPGTANRTDSRESLKKSLKIEPENKAGASITEKFITNEGGEGFLFIPAMLIGISNSLVVSDEQIISEAMRDDSVLKKNILVSQNIAPHLKGLLDIEVLGLKQSVIQSEPVQSYYLTAAGVIRLNEAGVADQRKHYLRQFGPTTFFPDRPYFWKTVNEQAPGDTRKTSIGTIAPETSGSYKVDEIFMRTQPYIDLGGNGVVVTLSRGIKEEGVVKSGLFLDFSLGSKAKDLIKEKIERLGGFAEETYWRVTTTEHQDRSVTHNVERITDSTTVPLPDGQENLLKTRIENHVNDGTSSEIFGTLVVLDDSVPGQVVFTIPVGPSTTQGPPSQSNPSFGLLYCKLDLDGFQWRVSVKAAIIAVSFMLFVSSIILLVVDYVRRLQEQEKAFQSVGRVMSKAPVAYCRLDERDKFIEMNQAFAKLLGYTSLSMAQESLINKRTFESLLVDSKSRKQYNEIREKRRNRRETDPYSVQIRGEGDVIEVEVHGASVPMPKSHPKAIPQTFGILVEEGVEVISERAMIITPSFGAPNKSLKTSDIFVLMPFTPELKSVYEDHIRDVAESLGLTIARADEILTTRAVMSDVWTSIYSARVIIADCTGRNPNVFYEIGMAHVLGKPVILMTQDANDVPFDISHLRRIPYEYSPGGMKRFEKRLEELLKTELGLTAN